MIQKIAYEQLKFNLEDETKIKEILRNLPSLTKSKYKNNLAFPDAKTIDLFTHVSYNLKDLIRITKHYNLKQSGSKFEKIKRIIYFLYSSKYVIILQKMVRGHLIRKYIRAKGPALFDRSICTNETDFYSLEPLTEISQLQFISYKDEDDFVYGFDIGSLFNIYKTTRRHNSAQNPYNRKEFPPELWTNIKKIFDLNNIYNFKIRMDLDRGEIVSVENTNNLNTSSLLQAYIIELFQHINSLGNYSDSEWLTNLNKTRLIRLYNELLDIWNYRLHISDETKRNIYPPSGNPFSITCAANLRPSAPLFNILKEVVLLIERLTSSGVDNNAKGLGCLYVLGSLTIVNESAAIALPWLYESFRN